MTDQQQQSVVLTNFLQLGRVITLGISKKIIFLSFSRPELIKDSEKSDLLNYYKLD